MEKSLRCSSCEGKGWNMTHGEFQGCKQCHGEGKSRKKLFILRYHVLPVDLMR